YSASVALAGWPFPYFDQPVNVTLRAVDRAGNEATTSVAADVTRLRWAIASEAVTPPQLTGAAIAPNGNIIVGGSNSKLYFFDGAGNITASPLIGSVGITSAPSIGPTAIWVASNDGKVYAVAADGSAILNAPGCDTLSATVGVPALFGAGRDVALVGSTAAQALYAVRVNPPLCAPTDAGEPFASSAAVAADSGAYAITRALNSATNIRRYTQAVSGSATQRWVAGAGTNVLAPLALDLQSRVLMSSQDGTLLRAVDQGASGSVAPLASLPAQAEASPIVLGNGDVVVGLTAGAVHRLSNSGAAVWASPPDVGDTVRGLAALSAGLDGSDVLATTALGEIAALRPDGTIAWSGRPATAALSFPAVVPAAPGGLPTAYAGSQDGKLYAVVVDGPLDAAAPWPKAHHDLANSANASSPLP
ncbi:MAG TPA: hypothetical protein VFR85_16425, partial [Anaeromyxobacteraceae bacterium]|nr:hypothetical protein [Anaeromyxobacteraceae bacterium]